MRRALRWAWPVLRLLGGAAILGVLLWRFGTGPFADAWRVASWPGMVAALLLTGLGTLASAWRWRAVAQALGVPLTVRESVVAYYRSQVLNSWLPGGVLGDAHRGYRHGRSRGSVGTGLRATIWDRATGQIVQIGLLAVVLVVLETPLQDLAPAPLAVLLAVAVVLWVLARRHHGQGLVAQDGRALLGVPCVWRIVVSSCLSSAVHVAMFAVAARAVGVRISPVQVVAIALVVLVGSAVPLNIAGWGPREGVMVWVFGAVGLGATTGLTVSIVLGVLSVVGTLPGLLVLLTDAASHRRARTPATASRSLEEVSHD